MRQVQFPDTDNVVTANQILANARSMRKTLAAQSTEASKRLSDAVLDVVLYSEKVESTACLLTLADSCIGQIRARMRALGISIHLPSAPDTITLSDSGSMPIIPGTFFLLKHSNELVSDETTDKPVGSA